MRRLIVILLMSLTGSMAIADKILKTVPLEQGQQTSAYIQVPEDFRCHVKIPEDPTAFCAGPGGSMYHVLAASTLEGWHEPQQVFNRLMQHVTSTSNVRILEQYSAPEIAKYREQRDASLLYLRGQRVSAIAFDSKDLDEDKTGVSVVIISLLPNNGAPVTVIDGFGITVPSGQEENPGAWRRELRRFVNSYQYNPQWVEVANQQTVNFEAGLSARNKAFNSNQQRIHQNNMDALDRSHNAYREHSAASDRAHSQYRDNSAASDQDQSEYIDSIHERQQLIDPETGQRYEADGYYDHNYVNPNDPDVWVRSNDPTWNPNVNVNQGEDYNRLEEYDSTDE